MISKNDPGEDFEQIPTTDRSLVDEKEESGSSGTPGAENGGNFDSLETIFVKLNGSPDLKLEHYDDYL